MKHFYSLLFLISSSFAFSQIPSNYYDSADGLSGYALKSELKNIITNGHITRDYDQLYDGNGITGSQGYVDTHSDVAVSSGNNYENDGTVLDFYSENPADDDGNPATPTANNDPYNYTHGVNQCGNQTAEGDCYNREHLVPQSSFGGAYPMYSDIHHVIPTDGRVNNFRGSLPFGEVATPDWTSLNGSMRGSSAIVGYSGTMFEPIDEFKGDIARALLYFATRYEDTVDAYTSFDMFNGTNDQVFQNWAIEMLLDWHYNVDPVDQRERDRNHAAYNFQGNANPFVDHPEYANAIWNPTPDTEAPTAPTNLVASNPTSSTMNLSWDASTDNVGVVSYDIYVDGTFEDNTGNTNTSYTVTGLLSETNYCFTVYAKDAAGNTSSVSNQDCESTTANNSGTVDLFFSEYVEGSGTNKALEIANFTGSSVNLADYTLKLASNANNFSYTYTFPSESISNGDVFVVANSGLLAACQSQQDDVNNSITGFNGNDAIGLFKNDVLIDIIGIEGDGNTFAENVTLIRKETVQFPTTTFDINEWHSVAQDDCSDLGIHNQTLSVNNSDISEIGFHPNPLKGNELYFNTDQTLNVEIYNVLGKKVLVQLIDSNHYSLNLSNLSQGIYLVKISNQNQTVTKKLIKQ